MLHSAGLRASFSFFQHAIDWDKMQGRLFTTKYTKTNTRKLRDRLYLNPKFTYRDSTFNFTGGEGYLVVSPHFYIHKHFQDSIHNLILNSKLLPQKKYTYSDLGFVLLKDIVEEQSATPFDVYCRKHFFKRLGAYNTDFNAHFNLDTNGGAPANKDDIFRKSQLHGYVHDPIAALMGGVSGNAGLFSTAEDLAKIMSVYLNRGTYGGERLIDSRLSTFSLKHTYLSTKTDGVSDSTNRKPCPTNQARPARKLLVPVTDTRDSQEPSHGTIRTTN